MSYILDALKKTEAERNPEAAAQLSLAETSHRRNVTLVTVAALALVLNVVLVGAWLWSSRTTPINLFDDNAMSPQEQREANNADPVVQTEGVASVPTAAERSAATVAGSTRPARVASEPAAASTLQDSLATSVTPRLVNPETLPLSRLDRQSRGRFSELDFTWHLHSSEPEFRNMVVNGTKVTEGDRIADDLTVVEITESGAIFAYRDVWVEVEVLDIMDAE